MIERLLTQTAQVFPHLPGAKDAHGNKADTFGAPVSYPARLEQTGASETVSDRDALRVDARLFLPAAAVISGHDRVTVDGVTYEVAGPPQKARTRSDVHHVEAELRHVEG